MASLNLQFQIPDDIRFEQAITIAQEILALPTDTTGVIQAEAVAGLLQTANGARGFFVTFLTGDSSLADTPTPELLHALRSAPNIVASLMTKNLAMSTAMELTHQANGDVAQATGSARVKSRSLHLIQALQLPELQTQLQQLLDSTMGQGNTYTKFLDRWDYNATQRQAIQQAVATVV